MRSSWLQSEKRGELITQKVTIEKPEIEACLASLDGEICQAPDDLIRLEKAGIREYKTLVKTAGDNYHGLFKILLDGMIRDLEKHVEVLEFLEENLKSS